MKKQFFKKFSEGNKDLPFSLRYDWWNEVVKENWDVAVIENQGEVKAIWPYSITKKYGFTQLRSTEISPYTGPFIVYPKGQKEHRKYSYEKKILDELIAQLPPYHFFEQNCHLNFQNALPLYWKGFQLNVRYTYILKNITDLKNIYSQFADNIRREIKKAEKAIKIEESKDINALYSMMESTFQVQGTSLYLQKKTLEFFHEHIQKHACGKLFLAKNFDGKPIAGVGIIWDHDCAYYLLGGADSEFKNSGAMSLLMWKAIQFSSTVVNRFNFEGSMIPGIERFLRGFGGELKSYYKVSHDKSLFLKILKSIKPQ